MRKRILLLLAAVLVSLTVSAYNDHRGHNLDSLERAVGRWTPAAVDNASEAELISLCRAYRDLMLGYSALNGEKCVFYARKALQISEPRGWADANVDARRYIGQCFWGAEQYDSSLVYYKKALEGVEEMSSGAVSPTNPQGYDQISIDDERSALYGAIGNLYNMMDSIPQAMDWYARAGEIFDKYGWNQSNAILYYNIGETWVEQGDLNKALSAYQKSIGYGKGDSLMVAMAQKGLGRVYMERGRTWKAMRYLHAADEYFAVHEKEELNYRKENFEYMSSALLAQRRQMFLAIAGVILLILLVLGILLLGRKLRISRKQEAEASEVIEETLEDLQRAKEAPSEEEIPEVSGREKEILELMAKGFTSPQIAEGLFLSTETIKWYRKKLLVKFDVANAAELVLRAKEVGLI